MSSIWKAVELALSGQLDRDDDNSLWETVLRDVIIDAEALVQGVSKNTPVVTEVGRCSHWLRPHQTRWTADGGFAWPMGYGGTGYSRTELPQLDWSCFAKWNLAERNWEPFSPQSTNSVRFLKFRVAIPSRSRRHKQAAVHTVWQPGPPQHRRSQLIQLYGFRKVNEGWQQTAYYARPNQKAYHQLGTEDS